MNFHRDVLAAHAQFGGDLESMQKCYDWYDLRDRVQSLEAELEKTREALGEPLGHISAYGLEKLQTRRHYCVSVSHQAEKEYVIPIYLAPHTAEKAREAALEEAAKNLDEKAEGYEEDARDVSLSPADKTFASAVAVRLRGSAAAIRAISQKEG